MPLKLLIAILIVIHALLVASFLFTEQQEAKPVPVGKVTAAPEGPGWVDMLDADHRDGWGNINDDQEIFEITDDGLLHLKGNAQGSLKYVGWQREQLGNFELHFEVKVVPGGNSGVFLRQQPNDKIYRGFEIQVQDDHGNPPDKNTTGAIYDVVTPMYNMAFPAGEWNSYDIVANHDHITVTVNGWKVIDADLSKMDTPLGKFKVAYNAIPLTGTLCFQDHRTEAWYRNIRLKKLPESTPRETDFVPPEETTEAESGGNA